MPKSAKGHVGYQDSYQNKTQITDLTIKWCILSFWLDFITQAQLNLRGRKYHTLLFLNKICGVVFKIIWVKGSNCPF